MLLVAAWVSIIVSIVGLVFYRRFPESTFVGGHNGFQAASWMALFAGILGLAREVNW